MDLEVFGVSAAVVGGLSVLLTILVQLLKGPDPEAYDPVLPPNLEAMADDTVLPLWYVKFTVYVRPLLAWVVVVIGVLLGLGLAYWMGRSLVTGAIEGFVAGAMAAGLYSVGKVTPVIKAFFTDNGTL